MATIVKRLIFALTLLVACESNDPLVPSLTGHWTGSVFQAGGGSVPFTATLTQRGSTLSGTGGFSGATYPINGTVSVNGDATFSYRIDDIAVPTNPPRFITFIGSFTAVGRIEGTLINWDASPVGIIFRKQ